MAANLDLTKRVADAAQASANAANTHAIAAGRSQQNQSRSSHRYATALDLRRSRLQPMPLSTVDDGAYLQITCTMKKCRQHSGDLVWPRLRGILLRDPKMPFHVSERSSPKLDKINLSPDIRTRDFFREKPKSANTAILIKNAEIEEFQRRLQLDPGTLQIAVVGFVNYHPPLIRSGDIQGLFICSIEQIMQRSDWHTSDLLQRCREYPRYRSHPATMVRRRRMLLCHIEASTRSRAHIACARRASLPNRPPFMWVICRPGVAQISRDLRRYLFGRGQPTMATTRSPCTGCRCSPTVFRGSRPTPAISRPGSIARSVRAVDGAARQRRAHGGEPRHRLRVGHHVRHPHGHTSCIHAAGGDALEQTSQHRAPGTGRRRDGPSRRGCRRRARRLHRRARHAAAASGRSTSERRISTAWRSRRWARRGCRRKPAVDRRPGSDPRNPRTSGVRPARVSPAPPAVDEVQICARLRHHDASNPSIGACGVCGPRWTAD